MTVLVTGGTGFLGSYVCDELEAHGHEIVAVNSRNGDLTDPMQTFDLFDDVNPEMVVHLAAECGGIGINRRNPGRFWMANTLIGVNVLEACRIFDVQKAVLVGTVCAYPKYTPTPFHEDKLWDGYPEETNAAYGLAKRNLLVGAQAYRDQYGLHSVYLLPANLYGPGDSFDELDSHVIPALIRKMVDAVRSESVSIRLWGDGSPSREFLYVGDCAEAIRLALESYDSPEPVNIGTGREITIEALALIVAQLTGFEGEIIWDAQMPNGQPRRRLDTSRAEGFGFRAKTLLEDGLRETVEWYQSR